MPRKPDHAVSYALKSGHAYWRATTFTGNDNKPWGRLAVATLFDTRADALRAKASVDHVMPALYAVQIVPVEVREAPENKHRTR